ncbi:efflux transporter outer membrane subunit [Cupriavidus pauculus]|uniref:efflux transporter outer membrane subunit n=1 Tax=Cupriavidus pauculus TaxID=82633 RepID=UPI000780CD90|nr:efflux transporter outer membrane subunit [Cupriavidus pauculus]MBY4729444.1 efflux transporter outer membrane subunit [Cupriavidus pauculus]
MRKTLLCLSVASLLGGCGALLETPYERPAIALPDSWDAQRGPAAAVASQTDRWWEVFGDQQLDRLVERVLERNADLAAAAIRLQAARLQAGLAQTNLTPDFSAGGNGSVSKNLGHGSPSQRTYGTSLNIAYELDLWGKLARTRDAATWAAQATAFDLESTELSLIGTTAATYWSIAELNAKLADARADVSDARRVEALVLSRYRAGADGMAELALARRTVATNQANYEGLLQQRETQRKALAILLNDVLPSAEIEDFVLPDVPLPDVRPGLPASVLAQRPDVAAAEARIRNSLTTHDAKKASFFPTLSLTGSLGTSSRDLGQVLTNPIGTLGAGLALPFLQWNTVRLNVGISRTDYEASVVAYRKTLYQAFAEVDEALSMRESLAREGDQLALAMEQAEKAEAISAARYRVGKSNIRFWLDDQQTLRQVRASVVSNRLSRLRAQMTLYQALGGAA